MYISDPRTAIQRSTSAIIRSGGENTLDAIMDFVTLTIVTTIIGLMILSPIKKSLQYCYTFAIVDATANIIEPDTLTLSKFSLQFFAAILPVVYRIEKNALLRYK